MKDIERKRSIKIENQTHFINIAKKLVIRCFYVIASFKKMDKKLVKYTRINSFENKKAIYVKKYIQPRCFPFNYPKFRLCTFFGCFETTEYSKRSNVCQFGSLTRLNSEFVFQCVFYSQNSFSKCAKS